MEKKSNGMMAVIAALVANILVAISKFVGYLLSGSAAMLNESIHSVVDCGNQALLLVGCGLDDDKASCTSLEKDGPSTFLVRLWPPCSFSVVAH